MIISTIPKIPFIDKQKSIDFYIKGLKFELISDYTDYLIIQKDNQEIHLFEFENLVPSSSDFMIYFRVTEIEKFYQKIQENGILIHPNGKLEAKIWQQKEFSVIDPNGTLLTFGESL